MSAYIFQKKWFIHLAIWFSYFFLLTWFFTDLLGFAGALTRSVIIIPMHAFIFYLNLLVLMPYVLEKKWKLIYYLIIINLIILILFLLKIIDDLILAENIKNQMFLKGVEDIPADLIEPIKVWRRNNPIVHERRLVNMRVFANGFTAVIVLLISVLIRNTQIKREKEDEANKLKTQMLEAESKILKWQINPHFLFNTLNNIYALTQMKSDRAPDAVHRLSKMLRYVIYDCNEIFVSLEDEINYMKSYIALQLLKDDEIANINYEFADVGSNLKIAPMLLISFVENSFKHSKIEDLKNGWIDISLKTVGSQLVFKVRNSLPEIEPKKDKQSGVGLENVQRRLDLIYQHKHELNIEKTNTEYIVLLTLELNEN